MSVAQLKGRPQYHQKMEAQETSSSLGDRPIEPPPADWLEPVEDSDEDLEEEENVDQPLNRGDPERDDTGPDVFKRTLPGGLRSRTLIKSDDLWVDWPNLGKGWKRKEVYRNSGTRSETYYMSPDGVQMRSKVEIANSFPNVDLRSFDFKKGLFLNKKQSKQKQSVTNSGDKITLGQTTPPTSSSIPTIQPHTPQRPNSNPNSRPSSDFGSPPHLTPISPLKQRSTQSPALNPEALNTNTTPPPPPSPASKHARSALIPKSLLHPSVRPVSPVGKQKKKKKRKKKKHSASLNGHTPVTVSPRFPSPPVPKRIMDPKMLFTLNKQHPGIRNCTRCTTAFSSVRNEELCPPCLSAVKKIKIPNQNMVFKKIGHGKWILASADNMSRQNKSTGHGKNLRSLKSRKLLTLKPKKNIKSEDNEEKTFDGYKKRSKRMCFKCAACCRTYDCGKCDNCIDKPKFGGRNTKRQKCRLRQCHEWGKLCKSRKYNFVVNKPAKHCMKDYPPIRPRSTRPHKRPAWKEDYMNPDEEAKKEGQSESTDEADEGDKDDEDYTEFELEQNDDIINVHASGAANSEESLKAFPLVFQNGQLQVDSSLLQTNETPRPVILYMTHPAGGAVALSEEVQTLSNDMGYPPVEEGQLELEESPPISVPSLADGSERLEGSGEPELLHLLGALHRTVLPAHWVAVLAKGPALQLLQCSRRSAVADTLLHIEPGFRYMVSVAGLPLPTSHPLYVRHPLCLTSVSSVVELLLEMEGLAVCQGYPWDSERPVRPHSAVAVLCGRAPGCHILVDPQKEGEHCDECHPPSPD